MYRFELAPAAERHGPPLDRRDHLPGRRVQVDVHFLRRLDRDQRTLGLHDVRVDPDDHVRALHHHGGDVPRRRRVKLSVTTGSGDVQGAGFGRS